MTKSISKSKIDYISLSVFCGLAIFLLVKISLQINNKEDLLLVVLAAIIGHFLADLFSGLLHWVCDSFGNENTKFWGPAIIAPFRRHHRNPSDICEISLSENLGSSSLAGNIITAILFISTDYLKIDSLFALSLTSFFVIFAVLSNLFHRWSHLKEEQKNIGIKFLQKTRLVITSRHHKKHHVNNFRTSYCVSCGWANLVTDHIPWQSIENNLSKFGVETDFS